MNTLPFKHSPLNPNDPREIRIIELLPSRNLRSPIRCELRRLSLDEGFQYEAVSYTWGDSGHGHTVFVNGAYTLDVTPNCLEVLTSLRQRVRRRLLWIDAICIDQGESHTSKRERDHQIQIMGDIYRKSQKVLVWLGPAEPSTSRTIARLKLIAKVEAAARSGNFGSSALRKLGRYLFDRMSEPHTAGPAIRPQYQALTSMIRSPWWQRVWTLQEQALAKQCEAHHGRYTISLPSWQGGRLALLPTADDLFNQDARDLIRIFCQAADLFQQGSRDWCINSQPLTDIVAKSLLEIAFLLEAKLPIDKIYGLYGILTTYCNLPLSPPDYNKTAEDVYEETVWTWINTRGDLSILKLASRPIILPELPSWVPAWHHQHPKFVRNVGRPNSEHFGHSHFNWEYPRGTDPLACQRSVNASREVEDPIIVANILSPGKLRILHARSVGRLPRATETNRCTESGRYPVSIEDLRTQLDWCRLVNDHFGHSPASYEKALDDMFGSLLHPRIYRSHHLELDDDQLMESFRAWFGFITYLNEASEFSTLLFPEVAGAAHDRKAGVDLYFDVCSVDGDEKAMEVLESRYSGDVQGRDGLTELARQIRSMYRDLLWMRNHSLRILDNDSMLAVTDYWCQEGDEVFVFPGSDSPFVLRKQPEGDCYRLVGPALVDRLLRVGYQNWRSEGDNLQDVVLI